METIFELMELEDDERSKLLTELNAGQMGQRRAVLQSLPEHRAHVRGGGEG